MSESSWPARMLAFGYEQQAKFDFYMVALTFTILGLAIQTGATSVLAAALVFELMAWSLLLISGVAGVSRLASQPHVFQVMGVQAKLEDQVSALEKGILEGRSDVYLAEERSTKPAIQVSDGKRKDLAQVRSRADELVAGASIRYKIHHLCFAAGLFSLAIARGYAPLLAIASTLRSSTGS